jgi:hypothetical protein
VTASCASEDGFEAATSSTVHASLSESRPLLELAACLPAYPLLQRAPRGDGRPVQKTKDSD